MNILVLFDPLGERSKRRVIDVAGYKLGFHMFEPRNHVLHSWTSIESSHVEELLNDNTKIGPLSHPIRDQ